MKNKLSALDWLRLTVLWSARFIGAGMFLIIMLFAIGEGIPNPFGQPPTVQVELAGFLIYLIGIPLAFKWERKGGGIQLLGLIIFYSAEYASNGKFPGGLFPAFWIPALLFVLYGSLPQRKGAIAERQTGNSGNEA